MITLADEIVHAVEMSGARRKPTVIYLDLNHWYTLGDAMEGRSSSANDEAVLRLLPKLVADGVCQVPLSAVHYMELMENPRDRHRSSAAAVMAEVSGFCTLAPAGLVIREELDVALQAKYGRPEYIRGIPKLGIGFGFAFGVPGEFRIKGPPEAMRDLEERVGQQTIRGWEAWANDAAQHAMLEGPPRADDEEIPGFNRYAARRTADEEVESIRRMVQNLGEDDDLRKRLGDAVAAREFVYEFFDIFKEGLLRARLSPPSSKEDLTAILRSMPSRWVACDMRAHYLKDLQHQWTVSDTRDIAAMSMAVPYCDLVVTDKAAAHALSKSYAPQAFHTTVLSTLDDLLSILREFASVP